MKYVSNRYARIGLALVVAVLLIAVISGSAAAAGPVYHTVLPGQTLYSIATYYGVSVWALACANGLYNPNYIYYGMVLTIPYGGYGGYGGCHPAYHPMPPVYPAQPIYPPAPPVYHPYPMPYPAPHGYDCFYRVRWGDSLTGIAWHYGTTSWNLAQANGLHNPNYIYAGQVLRIPGCN